MSNTATAPTTARSRSYSRAPILPTTAATKDDNNNNNDNKEEEEETPPTRVYSYPR